MDGKIPLFKYILLGLLLLLSFYFSGSETAIFSLNRLERNSLRETKNKSKKRILCFLLDNQEQLLITILTGNMVVNIFASSIGSEIGEHLFSGESELISIILMTMLLLLIGELTPKRIAVNHSKGFTRLTARPLYALHLLFTPVRKVLNYFSALVLGILRINIDSETADRHAVLLSAAELGFNRSILLHSEYIMFKSYLAFKDKNAGGVMVPRVLLKTFSFDLMIGEILNRLEKEPDYITNSTIILHKGDRDHLYGWIPAAELLACKFEKSRLSERISTLSRNFHTVPQSKDLPVLIEELREADIDIALLVDEYGGTAGVVWFRDIIRDVLKVFYGSCRTRLDMRNPEERIISGAMTVEEFQEFLGIDVDSGSETVAGFFLEKFDNIPVPGDEIVFHEVSLKVAEMSGTKILNLKLEIRPEE